MAKIEVKLLKIGQCQHPEFATIKNGSFCNANFPALVGLILHSNFGPILFDTGYDNEFFEATKNFPEKLYAIATPIEFTQNDNIANQLKIYGLKCEDIKIVILSHFHGDHIAGLKNFPNAKIYCAKNGLNEMKIGNRFSRTKKGFLSNLLPLDLENRTVFFESFNSINLGKQFLPFENGIDLLGDKSLIAIELKGHCKGHWGLAIMGENKPIFFIGDAAWTLNAIANFLPPPFLTTALLGDSKTYRQTLFKLFQLYNTMGNEIEIIPSHCQITANEYWAKYGN